MIGHRGSNPRPIRTLPLQPLGNRRTANHPSFCPRVHRQSVGASPNQNVKRQGRGNEYEGGRNSMAGIHALDRLIGNDYPTWRPTRRSGPSSRSLTPIASRPRAPLTPSGSVRRAIPTRQRSSSCKTPIRPTRRSSSTLPRLHRARHAGRQHVSRAWCREGRRHQLHAAAGAGRAS